MREVRIVINPNKELNSVYELWIGDNKIPITDDELVAIVKEIKFEKESLIERAGITLKTPDDIEDLKEQIQELEMENGDLQEQVEELTNILDEEGIE